MKNHFLICVLSFFALTCFGQSSDATLNSLNSSTIQGRTYHASDAYNMNAAMISSKLNVDRISVTVQAYSAKLAAIAALANSIGFLQNDGSGNFSYVQGQPLDSDLTTIAGLTATTDNFLQAKSSAWASRTVAQVKTDLGISNVTFSGPSTGRTYTLPDANTTLGFKEYGIACSDLSTALTTGTTKAYFRIPRAFTVTAVRASLLTAQSSGSILTIDINESGTTILSTKLTIDNSEKTSQTAATPYVISDSSLADDAEITIDIDVAGSGGIGLIIWIIGY